MVHENGALDATLAAAAGDDPALLAELRAAFVESLERNIDLLGRARCDGNWSVAAMRLKGLAASFHAGVLLALAEEAIASAPGEPTILRKLETFKRDFSTARP
jgi:hypothetical protein